ncbi:ribosome maturation factor RimM [Eubacteriales bacterium KG127]
MNNLIKIGKIVAPQGIKGQVRVYNYSNSHRYDNLPHVIIDKKIFEIQTVGHVKNMIVLKLKGLDDRNAAELMRGKDLYMEDKFLEILGENEYFIKDLIGLKVRVLHNSNSVGEITNVLQHGPVDLYEVKSYTGKISYVPAVKEFIKNIDMKNGVIIETIPGLLEDED